MLGSLYKLPCLMSVKFTLDQGKVREFFSFRCVASLNGNDMKDHRNEIQVSTGSEPVICEILQRSYQLSCKIAG